MKIDYTKPLTEEFIRKNQNELDWDLISSYQKLSEEFIEEFQNKINWLNIFKNQQLSEEFIRKFHHTNRKIVILSIFFHNICIL